MKLETFFEKFDHFTDAPDAVAKMRQLVLTLAVQGRLVATSADNPVSAEQLAAEKQRRLRELNLRSHPETPHPTESDLPFSLPKSWYAVSLGDLAFSCPTSYGEDPIPSLPKAGVVKVGNIDNKGGFKGQFSERGFPADEIDSLLARRGDLMVVKSSGSAENVHSGKTALCTAEHDGKIVGSNFVLRLRLLGTPALPEYIWRVLTSRYSRAWVEGTVQTMTYPNLKWSDFARLPFPLPPLAEQKRIVAKVDELMALCDRLEAQQQDRETRHAALAHASLARFADAPTPANLNFLFHKSYTIPPADLRKSILTLAVQGKLVPQDPSDEPAETLNSTLPHQLRAIADQVGVRFSAPAGLVEASDNLPPGWGDAAIQSIGITQTGTTPSKSESSFTGRDIPFIKPGDIQGDAIDYENEGLSVEGLSAGRLIPKNSILMVSIGGSIGKTAIVDRDVSCNQQINSVSPAACIEPRFVLAAIRSGDFQSEVMNRAAQGTLPIISKGKWETIRIPIPPPAEQRRIVAKVDQLMPLVDQLETQLAASRATAANLLEALIAELANTSKGGGDET